MDIQEIDRRIKALQAQRERELRLQKAETMLTEEQVDREREVYKNARAAGMDPRGLRMIRQSILRKAGRVAGTLVGSAGRGQRDLPAAEEYRLYETASTIK